eukprot:COSAG06_NODE_53175_length_301_cov_1.118812_1_plen_64_part_01
MRRAEDKCARFSCARVVIVAVEQPPRVQTDAEKEEMFRQEEEWAAAAEAAVAAARVAEAAEQQL